MIFSYLSRQKPTRVQNRSTEIIQIENAKLEQIKQLTKLMESHIDQTVIETTTKDDSLVIKELAEDDENVEGSGQVNKIQIRRRRSVFDYLFGPSTNTILRYGKNLKFWHLNEYFVTNHILLSH